MTAGIGALSVVGIFAYQPSAAHRTVLLEHASVPTSTTSTTTPPCSESDPCWNCETMGNNVCGRVNVELYEDGYGDRWVRVWDEHNRLVFGPVLIEGVEH